MGTVSLIKRPGFAEAFGLAALPLHFSSRADGTPGNTSYWNE